MADPDRHEPTPGDPGPDHDETAGGRFHEFREQLVAAAIEAELETGDREADTETARRNAALRLARMLLGFVLIALGLAGLVLPGPGWLIVLLGLSLLPFRWAERTVRIIRRRIPGIPEDGRIPTSTWIIMAVVCVTAVVVSVAFGDDIRSWIAGLWGDPNSLFS